MHTRELSGVTEWGFCRARCYQYVDFDGKPGGWFYAPIAEDGSESPHHAGPFLTALAAERHWRGKTPV